MSAIAMGFVLLAISAGSGTWQPPALLAEEMPRAVPKWEYRVLTKDQVIDLGKKDLAAGLNKLGDESWELVAIEPAQVAERGSGLVPKPAQFYFKRLANLGAKYLEALKDRVRGVEFRVTMLMEKVAWMERMTNHGFLSKRELQEEKDRLKAAENALENARKELAAVASDSKTAPEKGRKPKKE